MRCAACGTENQAGRKFCAECGSRLAIPCPACGTSNTSSDRFCGECGTALSARAAGPASAGPPTSGLATAAGTSGPTRPYAPGGAPPLEHATSERRLVSVLFADLVGFTTLAQDRDPESVRELLTRYFDAARDVVTRYGGTVEKFIGDAVMAVWGTPIAHEDDAERAVRAALDLVDTVRSLPGPDAGQLHLRAAVLSGEAAVTIGALGQGMVAGDLVNTASRLQSVSPPNTVLVGEATYRAASSAIAFEPAGEQLLRGKTAPVPAWRALRVVSLVGGANRADRLEAPFVGRDAELRLLKESLHQTGREGRPRLVSVIGQAGIGKSRLVWEFHKYIDGVTEDIYWHQGRSPAYGEGVTFWALGEMVRKRAGLAETDDIATTREKIAQAVAEYVQEPEDRRWIEPRLLQLLGVEEIDGGEREELFAAWRAFFERVSEHGTVVLVFEDLQWADSGQIDFIDHLLEWSRTRPILIVTLARPELLDRRPTWGAGRRNFIALSLEPLADDEMRELLGGLVPGLPEPTVRAILERADGIPLYAVETVRMLLQDGRLEATDGGFRPVGDLARLEVPGTLQALIAARLDALDPADRSLLQTASILGQTFTVAALAAVTGDEQTTIEPALASLVRRELLVLNLDPKSPERGQYGFVQGLMREVAYATLGRRDRRALHLAAARYFESLDDDEIAGILASHYVDAYLAAPEGTEGEALAMQARLALRGAAERASSLNSHEQALAYLVRAVEIASEEADRADLLERAGTAAGSLGRYERADQFYQEAIDRYRAIDDRVGLGRSIARQASSLCEQGRTGEATALLEPALAELDDLRSDPVYVSLTTQLGRACFLAGDYVRALEWVEQAIEPAERLDLPTEIAENLITRGTALVYRGRPREAVATLRGALDLVEERGLVRSELRARMNISQMYALADPATGFVEARRGLELARRFGVPHWVAGFITNAAECAFRVGEWAWLDAAVPDQMPQGLNPAHTADVSLWPALLEAHRRGSAQGGDRPDPALEIIDPQVESAIALAQARVALAEGRLADVQAAASEAHRVIDWIAPTAMPILVRAALWDGDLPAARAGIAAFEGSTFRGQAIDASRRTIAAGLAASESRIPEAEAGFEDAARRWRDLEAWFELALCDLDCVVLLGRRGADVRGAADEARSIFTRLGAAPFLDRLERALVDDRVGAPAP